MKQVTITCPIAIVVLLAISVAACGTGPTSTTNQPISIVLVSDAGPLVRTAAVLASTSLTDLEALIAGSDHPGMRAVSDCLTASVTPQCWSQRPENSLLIAVQSPAPALWGKCSRAQIAYEDLSGTKLTIHVRISKAACTEVTAGRAHYSLYATPLNQVPHAVLAILLADEGDGIDPESKAHFPWQFQTVVDLRTPLPAAIATADRTLGTRAAVSAAWEAIGRAGWDISEVAAGRWDSTLSCSNAQ